MRILNLGCGVKTSNRPEVVNIDWSMYLRLKRNPLLRSVVPLFLSDLRRERFAALPDNVMVHNLAEGIPFPANSVDAVYHSHVLEHLDREVAEAFLLEVKRVLIPGGIHRIVVPDLERICREYLDHLSACDTDVAESASHDAYVAALLEQSVRKQAVGASQQAPWKRTLETVVAGDARRRGETHQWMYDRVNLATKLLQAGYKEVRVRQFDKSSIPNWSEYGLDTDDAGNPYKPGSLYLEAIA